MLTKCKPKRFQCICNCFQIKRKRPAFRNGEQVVFCIWRYSPSGYAWKPHFLLTNALVVRHEGNPAGLQASANALNAYIMEHQLTPITVGYNVTVKEAKTPLELDEMIVEIYVGVSPNSL